MPGLDLVKETYSLLPDEKLVELASSDQAELAEGAFGVLEEELKRRGIDIHNLPGQVEKEEISEIQTTDMTGDVQNINPGINTISYKDRMMIRSTWFMFLFCILLGIGVLIMLDKMIRRGETEQPVFAYVMIFSGLVGLIAVLYRKRIYKKQELRFDFEKENLSNERE